MTRRGGKAIWRCTVLLAMFGLTWGYAARLVASPQTPRSDVRLVASPETGWPQWRGPRRDGICDERGLLPQWPEDGLVLIWTTTGLGRGYSAPVIHGDRIFLTGDAGNALRIQALDLKGRIVWRATNGAAWKDPYPGARACCAYGQGRLFHMNAHGRVVGLDAATGGELWAVDVGERFGGQNITWGLSECLLVDAGRVVVTVGGRQALMAALSTETGETVWTSEPLILGATEGTAHQRVAEPAGEADPPSYAAPLLLEVGDRRLIVGCSLRHGFGVDADSGRLLWTRPLPTRFEVIAATPVWCGEGIFVTGPDAGGGRCYGLDVVGMASPTPMWTTPLDTCHGGLVCVEGMLYGSWYRSRKGWAGVDASTGAVRFEHRDLAMGSVLYADGRLYCLSQEGEMALIRPTRDGFEFTGRFRLPVGRVRDAWTHPVIYAGRLYLRYQEQIWCYNVRKP